MAIILIKISPLKCIRIVVWMSLGNVKCTTKSIIVSNHCLILINCSINGHFLTVSLSESLLDKVLADFKIQGLFNKSFQGGIPQMNRLKWRGAKPLQHFFFEKGNVLFKSLYMFDTLPTFVIIKSCWHFLSLFFSFLCFNSLSRQNPNDKRWIKDVECGMHFGQFL